LIHFVVIWYVFSSFGMSYQDKSGNPDEDSIKIDGSNFLGPRSRICVCGSA
jgi:hypothetical protein